MTEIWDFSRILIFVTNSRFFDCFIRKQQQFSQADGSADHPEGHFQLFCVSYGIIAETDLLCFV